MTTQIAKNFQKIINSIPQLKPVLEKINTAGIRYGLYAGSHVSILTSYRESSDVDFLVADEDFVKLKSLFPYAKTKDYGDAVFLYIGKHDQIEFMSNADINIDESLYHFRLTDLCWQNTIWLEGQEFKVNLLNAIDTLLLKAILQRGEDKGKHDLEDIAQIIKHTQIDKAYLNQRLPEINPDKRLLDILKKFDLI